MSATFSAKSVKFLFSLLSFSMFVFPLFASEIGETIPPFTVTAATGEELSAEDLLGSISVIFYDTRHTAHLNNHLKHHLASYRDEHLPLLEKMHIIQIIDASSANFLTRSIWKRKLREQSRKYGVTIYADWKGELRDTLGLSKKKSNIVVVDPRGRIRFIHQGNPQGRERELLFELLLVLGKEEG